MAAPLVGEQLRVLGMIPTPGSFLVSSRTVAQLTFPLQAVFEQVLASLDLVLIPPGLGVRASCRLLEVLAGKTVSHLELVEPGGEAFVGTCNGGVRLLLLMGRHFRFPVLLSLFLSQSCASAHFFSKKPLLRLASVLEGESVSV